MPVSVLCYDCQRPSVTVKRCAGCGKARYCNSACQKKHWAEHIFDCTPCRPITTADHLALAARKYAWPNDPQTRYDYGFCHTLSIEDKSFVLSLWCVLLLDLQISPKVVHRWRVSGVLVQEIHRAFSADPMLRIGDEYMWFLDNQHLFDGTQPSSAQLKAAEDKFLDEFVRTAWVFTGGSPHETFEEIRIKISRLPPDLIDCYVLYCMVLGDSVPQPVRDVDTWMSFGFCAYPLDDPTDLSILYKRLINQCTFEDFCRAFFTSSLASLFRSNGIILDRCVKDVLSSSPGKFKSVWDLKRFISEFSSQANGKGRGLIRSVAVDYGFINCQDEEDVRELREVYGLFFWHQDADPLQLHVACMSGELYEHLKGLMRLTPKSKFVRLLKNPHSKLRSVRTA